MPERSSYKEGTPSWVDLQTTDQSAAKAFYAKLFGWTFDDMPMEGGAVYSLARRDGHAVAAIAPQTQQMVEMEVPPVWNTYIAVDDVDAAAARVADAGGQVAMEPFDVYEAGRMAFVFDPSGAPVALWQAGQHVGAGLVNEPGTLTWNELTSSDLASALPFYERVVGLRAEATPMGGMDYTLLYVGEDMVGGATAPQMEGIPNHWHVWFATDDVDRTVSAAVEAGGGVLLEPMDMEIGRIATIRDPQGAVFSVIAQHPAADA